jgi:hypothetical protein
MSLKQETREIMRARRARSTGVKSRVNKKIAAAAVAFAAAFLLLSAGQAVAATCAGGNVDGSGVRAGMCFGTMFPNLAAFHYSDQASADLAATMENPTPDPAGTDQATADDNPTLPAEFTYLGQFIDHNLDFDETPSPTANVNPSTLTNFESFRFDLNNVFGGGPTVDPQLYAADGKHLLVSGTLGTPQADGFPTVIGNNGVFDLSRNPDGTANLVEPRDDENQILSQISASFVAFYNDFVDQGMSYAQARHLTEDYYQEIVLTDVLPHFVGQSTIDKYLRFTPDGTAIVHTPDLPNANFTPIEFSVGAYRFGHSLVRNDYHINDILPPPGPDFDNNVPIFNDATFQTGDLTGGAPLQGPAADAAGNCEGGAAQSTALCELPTNHQIEWKYFVPALNADTLLSTQNCVAGGGQIINGACTDPGINFARATQTTISPALFNLPAFTIPGCADAADPICNGSADLISRDFSRGNFDGLASGQAIARELGCPVIPAASINPTSDAVFNTGTPLIYYVLAEAQKAHATLGCVGGSIVAQTFLRVLKDTPNSILNTNFTPDPSLTPLAPETPKFSFGDLLVDTKLAPRTS